MYCPNCGNKTSVEQKFCRSCGLSLEKIAQSLAEQLPTQLDESLQAQKEKIERLGFYALCIFGAGVLSLILYGVVYKLMLIEGKIFDGLMTLAFIALIACGLLAVILFAHANELGKDKSKRQLPQPDELPQGETTSKLQPETHLQPLPSVTERTTELLIAEKDAGTKERQDERS